MQRHAFLFYCLLFFAIRALHAQPAPAQPSDAVAFNVVEPFNSASSTAAIGDEETVTTTIANLVRATAGKKSFTEVIGYTKKARPVTAYYFPGRSTARALVIGGVHGTELAAIEVGKQLVAQLAAGDTPYYNVLVIPSLFPDNAAMAIAQISTLGSEKNIGRYSHAEAPDPNRQMPGLGTPYNAVTNRDYLGRVIEYENTLLLQTIQLYKPQRIVNIHAIRDTALGGVYADPRTDAAGLALTFESDSSLAVQMALFIEQNDGTAPGNQLATTPTALYYKDPPVAPPGQWQKRNCHGSNLPNDRGRGVSLGSWASTAVWDSSHPTNNRAAIRMLTMEFPGYKRPQDYSAMQQPYYQNQVRAYASAIRHVFLNAIAVENDFKPDK
ncbi:MAG TPA: hypothetical protein VM010_06705 [Chitinophagaceae bacterium]|nr:hypothetical protein [Chitinophagaceae bacterium]